MTYPFPTRHDMQLTCGYPTDFRALIASAKCLDMSIELRLTVTETISCGFQWPIVQRRVVTPKKEKSYRLEIYELQMQRGMKYPPIETNRSRVNSELIPEANRRGDASAIKSVEVHFNVFIRELEGYQLRHQ